MNVSQEQTPGGSQSLLDKVEGFFRKRIVAVFFARKQLNGPPDFRIGSGFLFSASGIPFIVTAAHHLERLNRWRKHSSWLGAAISFPNGPSSMQEYPLPSDLLDAAITPKDIDLFDVACIPCADSIADAAHLHDLKQIGPYFYSPSDNLRKRVLIGFNSTTSRLRIDEGLYLPTGNHHRITLGSSTFRIQSLHPTSLGEPPRLKSDVLGNDVASLAGLSGGLVIDLVADVGYQWIGVQSCQFPDSPESPIEYVKFTDARVVVDELTSVISQLAREMQDGDYRLPPEN